MFRLRAPLCFALVFLVFACANAVTAQVDSLQPKLKAGTVYAPELKIPSNAHRQYQEGTKDYQSSRFEEAAEHFKLAGRMYPKFSLAYSALAMSLLKQQRLDESHKALEEAIRLNPNNPDAVLTLGLLYLCEFRFSESEFQLQRVVAVFPHEPNARQVLSAIAMFRSDYNEAIKQTDAIEKKDVEHVPAALVIRGAALEKLGLVGEATACYERFLHLTGKTRTDLEEARAMILRLNALTSERRIEPAE